MPATERCRCGHDLAAHTGSGVAAVPCKVCGATSQGLLTGNCMGWDPTGAVAGPPDLDHAIQAATKALGDTWDWGGYLLPDVAKVAVEAAASILLQATRDRLDALRAQLSTVIQQADEADAKVEQLQVTRDRLADLEVYAAELHDLLEQVYAAHDDESLECPLCDDPAILAALQTDPPARGRAILEEVERLRKEMWAYIAEAGAIEPWEWTARFEGALGAAQKEDRGG